MPDFIYLVRSTTGLKRRGTVSAPDARAAAETLGAQGLFVISLEPDRTLAGLLRSIRGHGGERVLPHRQLAVFFRQFATMFGAGVPMLQALMAVARQNSHAGLGRSVEAILADLRGGSSLAEAFAARGRTFPPLVAGMIAAGEASGALQEVGDRLATHFEREDATQRKVRAAVAYPTLVLSAAVVVMIFVLTFVIPMFEGFFSELGVALPAPTRAVLAASAFARQWGWLVALVVAGCLAFLRQRMQTPAGQLARDRLLLSLPVVGPLINKRVMARFARTLSTLLAGGLPVLSALDTVSGVLGNAAVETALRRSLGEVRQGATLSEQLRADPLFPPMVTELVAAGEESGSVDHMLARAADFYDVEVEATLTRLTSLIEPALIIAVGAVVGSLVLSVILPMLDALQQV